MAENNSDQVQAMHFARLECDIYGNSQRVASDGTKPSLMRLIKEAPEDTVTQRSGQGVDTGRRPRPFNFAAVQAMTDINEHHATCIGVQVAALVGLGHRDEETDKKRTEQKAAVAGIETPSLSSLSSLWIPSKVDEVLNPLCSISWQDTLTSVAEDYVVLGNGYLEVVRRKNAAKNVKAEGQAGDITGLHHLSGLRPFIYVEDNFYNYHYEIPSGEGTISVTDRRFARFGDKNAFIARWNSSASNMGSAPEDTDSISEVIHFKRPGARNRWYGIPHWLSAVPSIEVYQYLRQYKADFYLNRGVPEFLVWVIGPQVDAKLWKQIQGILNSGVGPGNAYKSGVFNIVGEAQNIKVQVDKLGLDSGGKEDDATEDKLALSIVSAHSVPPLLAGIQIPGKLGATNELPNALMSFQVLRVAPQQRIFSHQLGNTLGNPDLSNLKLKPEDFLFNTITEEIDVGAMDTVARMRQTPAQAKAEGRSLEDGVKK